MAGVSSYAAVKDSGEPWLGEVPQHWVVAPLRRGFRAVTRRDVSGDEVKMSMSRHLGLVPSSRLGGRNAGSSGSLIYSVCHPGDLVMNKYQAHAGLFGCAMVRGLITPNYTVFRALPAANSAYFARLLASAPYNTAFKMQSYGVGDGMSPLYTNVFYRVPAPFPPLPEQAAIVRFLDHADRRIRSYLGAKRNLIRFLGEQKQAILHRAVTRGVDAAVRLRHSGVDWLGDVPEHWSVVRNKAILTPRRRTVGAASGDYTLLALTLRGVIPRDLENPEGKFPASFDTYQAVEAGDLIFCLFDMDETPRTVGVATQPGMVTGAYSVFTPVDPEVAEFLYHFYLAMDGQKRLRPFYTGLRKVIQGDKFLGIKVALPPLPEIRAILGYVRSEMARIDGLVARAETEVALVSEYRTRLIADVVTGRLDILKAAAALPDVVAEPEDSDVLMQGEPADSEAAEDSPVDGFEA